MKIQLLAAICGIFACRLSADAIPIGVNGIMYDVTTIEMTFGDLRIRPDFPCIMPWFGSEYLAEQAALEFGQIGVWFAYAQGNYEGSSIPYNSRELRVVAVEPVGTEFFPRVNLFGEKTVYAIAARRIPDAGSTLALSTLVAAGLLGTRRKWII